MKVKFEKGIGRTKSEIVGKVTPTKIALQARKYLMSRDIDVDIQDGTHVAIYAGFQHVGTGIIEK